MSRKRPLNPRLDPGSTAPGVLAMGWDSQRVRAKYLALAGPLVDQGFIFRGMTYEDEADVRTLLNENITGDSIRVTGDDGGLVAHDREGTLASALLVGAATFEDGLGVFVRGVATAPTLRGQGLGTVLLDLIPQLIQTPPTLTIGNCKPAAAGFYQQAGFTVLKPGIPLPFLLGTEAILQQTNQTYSSWFFRHW